MSKRHLVIGCRGQVGSAVFSLLSEKYRVTGIDLDNEAPEGVFDVIHVCIPWSESFIQDVDKYQGFYGADGCLTIIHSTVKVGTSDKCKAVHSPVRGVHPTLLPSLKTFVKYFGGSRSNEAAGYFEALGVPVCAVANAQDTEAQKLWDTTGYGLNLILEKAAYDYCQRNGLNFDVVYSHANKTYNEGFAKMGLPQFSKYNLKHVPGPIGGHCIIPNCELLGGEIAEFVAKPREEFVKPPLDFMLARGC